MSEQTFEQKEGNFNLNRVLPEDKKTTKSPDFWGTALFNGVKIRLSGWAKVKKDGTIGISGYIEEDKPREQTPASVSEVDAFLGGESVDPMPF
jgi:hypothetical protein